jgi:hypothetical protein
MIGRCLCSAGMVTVKQGVVHCPMSMIGKNCQLFVRAKYVGCYSLKKRCLSALGGCCHLPDRFLSWQGRCLSMLGGIFSVRPVVRAC